jgi:hypothetical protein
MASLSVVVTAKLNFSEDSAEIDLADIVFCFTKH